jgi:hypothetical protein
MEPGKKIPYSTHHPCPSTCIYLSYGLLFGLIKFINSRLHDLQEVIDYWVEGTGTAPGTLLALVHNCTGVFHGSGHTGSQKLKHVF